MEPLEWISLLSLCLIYTRALLSKYFGGTHGLRGRTGELPESGYSLEDMQRAVEFLVD